MALALRPVGGGGAGKAHGSVVGMHLVGLNWIPCELLERASYFSVFN